MTCSKFLLGFDSKFSLIQDDELTQEVEVNGKYKDNGSPASPDTASGDQRCLLEIFVSGFATLCEAKLTT
jgi:hypothetical protein